MVAALIRDDNDSIFAAITLKLSSTDVLQGEAHVALLAASMGFGSISLEDDALLVILANNSPSLFSSWYFAICIYDISLVIYSFQS